MSLEQVLFLLAIFVHFVTFIGIFTKLENRLTTLETTLAHLLKNLEGVQFVERRDWRNRGGK